jgi:hypothetical protein
MRREVVQYKGDHGFLGLSVGNCDRTLAGEEESIE